jgi:SAM-dependent methyltransferase
MASDDIQSKFYSETYSKIISNGIVGFLQARIHTLVEANLSEDSYQHVLELGAGNLEHLKFISFNFSSYLATDIRFTTAEISRLKESNPQIDLQRISLAMLDAESPNLPSQSFDLILATCVLIHLSSPENALVSWRELTRPGGQIAIYVPAEPGLFLRFGRRLLIRPKHKKLGISNSDLLYAREHVTSFYVLNSLIREIFSDCRIETSYWPNPLLKSWNLNAAAVFTITLPMS